MASQVSFCGISLAKFQRVFLMCLATHLLSACAMLFNVSDGNVEHLPLLSSAPALRVVSSFHAPTANFSSTDPNHSYFECQVDEVFTWTPCTSPFDLTAAVDRGFEGTFRTRSIGISGDVGSETFQIFRRGIMPSGVDFRVNAVAYQSDGKKLLGGEFTTYRPERTAAGHLVRLSSSGMVQSPFEFFNSWIFHLAVQNDGKILVAGQFTSYAGRAAAPDRFLRLNSDGTEDIAFSTNAGAGLNGVVSALAVQSDGKILVGGNFTSYNNNATAPDYLLRLNSDGTEDTTFSANAGVGFNKIGGGSPISALAVQSDGKILVGGYFTSYAGNTVPYCLLRLNSDGTVDATFSANIGVGLNNSVDALAVQSDGRILAGGWFTSYANSAAAPDYILRLNPNGTEDTAFSANVGVGFDSQVKAFAVQSDGKILVGGHFISYNGNAAAPDRFLRLNSDGTEDIAFSANAGAGLNAVVHALVLQSDGKILVGGGFTSYAGNVAATDHILSLNSDGTEDTAFSANAGAGFNSTVNALVVQSDGKILVGGYFHSYGGNAAAPDRFLRLNSDDTEDTAFSANAGEGFNDKVYAIAVQSDGKILVGGGFTSYAGNAAVPDYILRLNSDGTEDTAFSASAGVGFNNGVYTFALQSDGKILVGGYFTSYAGRAAAPNRILRLNSDGTEDTDFSANAGVGFNGAVYAIAVQSDGKILVGGSFTSYAGNGAAPDYILRLNSDGTVDTTFSANAGVGFDSEVHALVLQSNGKILAGGYFTSYAGNAAVPDYILRLNSDGTEDTAFSASVGVGFNNGVYTFALQSDGKILVGGSFTSYAGNAAAPDYILRLNSDGTEDTAFSTNAGAGFSSSISVWALAVQSDGRILVGGSFTKYKEDHFLNYTCELNPDGSYY